MKTTMITILAAVTLMASPAWAMQDGKAHDHENAAPDTAMHDAVKAAKCEDTVAVKVNGLVCDFCARALEKVFGKREEVAGIRVDLDKGDVAVAMKPGKTIDDETLTSLVTDSGYNVTAINRGCTNG